jgi:XisH protein
MPARNIYHDAVVDALVADGWTVTDDPLRLTYGEHDMYVDLGLVGSTLVAERAGREIAVEVQSFLGPSAINDLHRAVGRYLIYQTVLAEIRPTIGLYMAVRQDAFQETFTDDLGQLILARLIRRAVVFDEMTRRIVQWIN